MWGDALSDPSFYFSIAASIVVTGKIQSPSCNNKVALAETKIREWIGKDAKLITNSCDDIIILSKDGNKKKGLILIILLRIITHIYILRQRLTEGGKQIGYGQMMLNLIN